MKKILAGILPVLLSMNVSAALLSIEVYDSKLYNSSLGEVCNAIDEEDILRAQSSELFEFSLSVNNIGTFGPALSFYEELLGSQGQPIGTFAHMDTGVHISPFALRHLYSEDMDLMSAQYAKENVESSAENESNFNYQALWVDYESFSYLEEESHDPWSFEDYAYLGIGVSSYESQYWHKNENGVSTGQLLVNSVSIVLNQETDLPFSSFDEEEEVFELIKQAMLVGNEFEFVQYMRLISFELTNPLGNPRCIDGFDSSYCEENEGMKVLAEESLSYIAKARVTAVDYSEVPEPSTNLLLVLGLMGLIFLNRHRSL
ncbi:PEP-CTERM sorting domain-containing protein [Thalassomonas viridans]|uniref:PEP-CTERM sorting domain-containing protein n=1 Tax=Thalassomonas viridans TaxID=137584 RepID=A0AAE9Z4B6_9GAMM|nr:PEP-CTERM sorting domain-containing protein [Thalassomonas viridans]WDE06491.1 PEP-CTERM sorting domain-containing protein [Thalassomonas viridans]